MRSWIIWLSAAVAIVAAPMVCSAQTLADRVPADALIYVGWRGSADPGPGYEQSHLKAVLDQSEFSKLINQAIPAMIAKYSSNPQVAQISDMVVAIGTPLIQHPTAFYFGGLDLTDADHPVPHVAILCDAGSDAANMVDRATNLINMMPPNGPVKITAKAFGNLVVISTFEFAEHPTAALSDDANFKSTMAQVGKEPVIALYVDGEKFGRLIDTVVAKSKDKDAMEMWPRIRDALGIASLKRLAVTDGFDGRDWVSESFVQVTGPRTGLLALFDARPLDDAFLKTIPSGATIAVAGRFDFAELVKQIRAGIQKVSPEASKQVDDAIGQANDVVGLDIQNDFLGALGTDWIAYSDPTLGGYGGTGLVIINHPRDAEKLDASLTQLETLANKTVRNLLRREAPFVDLRFRQQTVDGNKIHFAALPIFTPSWTMKEGNWYFGMYPQVVVSAAARSASGKSILDNPAYQDLRKRLGGPEKISGVAFIDTPKLAPLGYQNVLLIGRVFLGAGDVFGLESPALVIPPLDKIMPELEPEGGITWVDDAGLHAKSLAAFPGDTLLASDGGGGLLQVIQIVSNFAPYMMAQHRERDVWRAPPPIQRLPE